MPVALRTKTRVARAIHEPLRASAVTVFSNPAQSPTFDPSTGSTTGRSLDRCTAVSVDDAGHGDSPSSDYSRASSKVTDALVLLRCRDADYPHEIKQGKPVDNAKDIPQ